MKTTPVDIQITLPHAQSNKIVIKTNKQGYMEQNVTEFSKEVSLHVIRRQNTLICLNLTPDLPLSQHTHKLFC